jgi:hypothetical protein
VRVGPAYPEVMLGAGGASAGDGATNPFPFSMGPPFSMYADDLKRVSSSLKKLVALGTPTICSASGCPFSVEVRR